MSQTVEASKTQFYEQVDRKHLGVYREEAYTKSNGRQSITGTSKNST